MPHARIEVARDRVDRCGLAEPRIVIAESRNRLRSGRALDDEVRLDELRGRERRLRRQIAQVLRLAQPETRPARVRGS